MLKKALLLSSLAALAACAPRTAAAQQLPLPGAGWRTVTTDHFTVHYPDEMAEWSLLMTSRLESIHEAVSSFVGNTPAEMITVIVDDPQNESNGAAFPGPVIYIWPTPPDPRSGIGENRSWSEILSLHEYTHIAHYTRPSRNPLWRLLSRLLPVRVDPIMVKAPRWVHEGNATYVEGLLTGSGRPHGTWRPAILRQWALEGNLPSYGEVSSSGGFYGGSMAYLVGSAFVEWLVEQEGEESLRSLWSRMTARRNRSFEEAFAGVYGGPPGELYGRFTAELTWKAMELGKELAGEGLEEGEVLQRLEWYTGDPAVSPDGERIALVLRSRKRPSRLVVWNREEEPPSGKELRARERALELDPEDVPGIEWKPREKKPVAILYPAGGRVYSTPRFMPDSRRLLVVRPEAMPDGRIRPDLFIWDCESGSVRRVTRGAAIREADPAPDGSWAVGLRCLNGCCGIVRIDLGTGEVTTLLEGGPDTGYYRPRLSPDGESIVASVQEGSVWKLFLMNRDGSGLRPVGPEDGVSRFDAVFTPGGDRLICVSTRGGIANLERIDIETGRVRPLTRVTGAAVAPALNPVTGEVLFLKLRSRGYDLNKLDLERAGLTGASETTSLQTPAGRIPVENVPAYQTRQPTLPVSYGLGPRRYNVLPHGSLAREGTGYGLTLVSTDPVGRLGWTLTGAAGDESVLRGASLRVAWRRFPPELDLEIFSASQYPSRNSEGLVTPPGLDFDYTGGVLCTVLQRNRISRNSRIWLGLSAGSVEGPGYRDVMRNLVFAGFRYSFRRTPRELVFNGSLGLDLAGGSFDSRSWSRALGSVLLGIGRYGSGVVRGEVAFGETWGDAGVFEHFAVGGFRPTLFDRAIMSQRIAMPALPAGFLTGEKFASYKGEILVGSVLSFYYWAGMAGPELKGWEKLFGFEFLLDAPAVPFMRVPGLQCTIGSGVRVDEPYPKKTRIYVGVAWRP